MKVLISNRKSAVKTVFITLALIVSLTCLSYAQGAVCDYDRNAPSLENARRSFLITKYDCAELELKDLLADNSLALQARADAHVLLAAVYYAMLKSDTEKRQMVMNQFKKAFTVYKDWRGELDIKSPDFQGMMEEAKKLVEADKIGTEKEAEVAYKAAASGCPSSKTPLIGTGVLLGSAVFYLLSSSKASDKWDDYKNDPLHPQNLYDSYTDANDLKKIAGVLTIASGVVTGYLWYKYFKGKKNCKKEYGFQIQPTMNGVLLSYSF